MAKPRIVYKTSNTNIVVRYDNDYCEYQVWVNGQPDYFTDYKEDAHATANHMAANY